jgi:hypothetical protein
MQRLQIVRLGFNEFDDTKMILESVWENGVAGRRHAAALIRMN